MLRRALIFFVIASAFTGGVIVIDSSIHREVSILQDSFISIGFSLVYILLPRPFNHLVWLPFSVLLWILARGLHLLGALGIYGTAIAILLGLVGLMFELDLYAYKRFGAIGSIAATLVLITLWLLLWRELLKFLSLVCAQLPRFVASSVDPIDKAISEGHNECDRLGDWISGNEG